MCCCDGACFPEDCTGGTCTLLDIPWEISAPGCSAIDGQTGVFSPFGGFSNYQRSGCGPCVCYESIEIISLPGKIKLELTPGSIEEGVDPPPPSCVELDCTIDIRLFLAVDSSIEGCCKVAVVVELLSVTDGLALTSGSPQNARSLVCIPQVLPVDNDRFRQFSLDSCECLANGAGFSGLFNLDRIAWTCTYGDHPPESECYPASLCCVLFNCSLSGSTLIM